MTVRDLGYSDAGGHLPWGATVDASGQVLWCDTHEWLVTGVPAHDAESMMRLHAQAHGCHIQHAPTLPAGCIVRIDRDGHACGWPGSTDSEGTVTHPIRGHVCDSHRERIRRDLHAMTGLMLWARSHEGHPSTPRLDRGARGAETLVPGQRALELTGPSSEHGALEGTAPTHDVLADLTGWAQNIAEETGHAPPDLRGMPDGPRCRRLCDWLDRHAEWAGDQPWADDWADSVRTAHTRLEAAAQWRPRPRVVPRTPCPGCGTPTLVLHPPREPLAEQVIRCDGCGWTDAEESPQWQAWMRAQDRALRSDAEEAARAQARDRRRAAREAEAQARRQRRAERGEVA